jgi:hypothetical protein
MRYRNLGYDSYLNALQAETSNYDIGVDYSESTGSVPTIPEYAVVEDAEEEDYEDFDTMCAPEKVSKLVDRYIDSVNTNSFSFYNRSPVDNDTST